MPLDLVNLDSCTRRYMLAELDADLSAGTLYLGAQLSEHGGQRYPQLLREALTAGTETTLAEALLDSGALSPPGRGQLSKEIGADDALAVAALRLAEREFHRFYIRGLCCRAIDQGVEALVIYRAKAPEPRRLQRDAMVGARVVAASLLADLRGAFVGFPPHGLPQCRDPGLSVRLP